MRTQRSVFVFLVSLHALPILPDFYTECTYFFTAVRKPSEKKKLSETTPVKAGFLASESLCFQTSPSVTSNVISAYPSAPFRIAVTVTTSPALCFPSCSWYCLIVSTFCSPSFTITSYSFMPAIIAGESSVTLLIRTPFGIPVLSESSSVTSYKQMPI